MEVGGSVHPRGAASVGLAVPVGEAGSQVEEAVLGVAGRAVGGRIRGMKNSFDPSRRQFFSTLVFGGLVSGLAFFGRGLAPAQVWAAGLPMLDPKDALAQTMGFHTDAKKVDAKKWPKIKETAGQTCGGCQFFTEVGKPTSPCSIFPGKAVPAAGWCSAWVKKAG